MRLMPRHHSEKELSASRFACHILRFGLVAALLFITNGQAQAESDCRTDGWLGLQLALRPSIGWEAGVLPTLAKLSEEQCLRIGPGLKLTYLDGLHAVAVARLSIGGSGGWGDRQIYLQGGPTLEALGYDVEAGLDWRLVALFGAVSRFGGNQDSILTVGVRFAPVAAAFVSAVALGAN